MENDVKNLKCYLRNIRYCLKVGCTACLTRRENGILELNERYKASNNHRCTKNYLVCKCEAELNNYLYEIRDQKVNEKPTDVEIIVLRAIQLHKLTRGKVLGFLNPSFSAVVYDKMDAASSSPLNDSQQKILKKIKTEDGNKKRRYFYACRNCYELKPAIITETDGSKLCSWCRSESDKLVLSEFSTSTHHEYAVIRKRMSTSDGNSLCKDWNSLNLKSCKRGTNCQFAHGPKELEVWKLEVGTFPISIGQLIKFFDNHKVHHLAGVFHCSLCNMNCETGHMFSSHCDSWSHRRAVISDDNTKWEFRNHPLNDKSICHIRHCDCDKPHNEEELEKMKQRMKLNTQRLVWARERGLISFVHQINEEYSKASSVATVMCDNLKDVSWELNTSASMTCKKIDTVTWTLSINCIDAQKLNHVAIYTPDMTTLFKVRAIRGKKKTEYVDHIDYEASNQFEKFNLNNGKAKFKVQFKPNSLGYYQASLLVEMRDSRRPVLRIQFSVTVLSDTDYSAALQSDFTCIQQEKTSWERSREIIRISNEFLSDLEKKVLVKYKSPDVAQCNSGLSEDMIDSLTATNYVAEMHSFLYREEKQRSDVLSKCNMKCYVAATKNYMSEKKGLCNSQPDELFGIFEMPINLNRDTNEGLLMLESCDKVHAAIDDGRLGSPVFELKLEETFMDHAILLFNSRCIEEWKLTTGKVYQLEVQFQLSRDRFCICHQALDLLEDHQLQLICPTSFYHFRDPTIGSYEKLDNDQLKVLNAVLEKPSRETVFPLLVVIGPFGTGKTYTMTECIQYILMKDPKAKILICTHTNSAADLYIENNQDNPNWNSSTVLRVLYHRRSPQTVPESVRECCLPDGTGRGFCYPTAEEVIKKKIVIATFSTAIYLGLKETGLRGIFTHVFLDEAGQVMEPEVIIPLTLVLNNQSKVVIAGDHKQICEKIYSKPNGSDASYTLLDRLYNKYKGITEPEQTPLQGFVYLRNNYRCVAPILKLISNTFYKEGILNCCCQKTTPFGLKPIQFHHVTGKCEQNASSSGYYNLAEAEKAVEVVSDLVQRFSIVQTDIIVLSLYAEQIKVIRHKMRSKRMRDVKVDRVRSIQGREYRVVVLSTVHRRMSKHDKIGSKFGLFSDVNLLNTAITRCEIAFIAIGDAVSLCSMGKCQPKWRSIIQECGSQNVIYPRNLRWEMIEHQVASLSTLNPEAASFVPAPSGRRPTIMRTNVEEETKPRNSEESDEESDSEESNQYDDILDDMLHEHMGVHPQEMFIDVDNREMDSTERIDDEHPTSNNREEFTRDGKKKKTIHPQYTLQHLRNLQEDQQDVYKRCSIHFTSWCEAEATVLEPNDEIHNIHISTKRKLGQAFENDEVLVEVYPPTEPDQKVFHGYVVGILKRFRELESMRFVCFPDRTNCLLMVPVSNKIPKFAIVKPKNLKQSEHRIPMYSSLEDLGKKVHYEKVDPDSYINRKLFVVRFYKWNKFSYYPLGFVEHVIDFEDQHKYYKITCNVPGPYRTALEKECEKLHKNTDNRRDLTDLFVFTIDPEGSKDLDDAMSIEKCKKHENCWKVGIHIADVASILPEGNNIDEEALKRATTFYAGQNRRHTSPMLPAALISKCSILPDGDTHLTISMFLHSSKPPNPTVANVEGGHIPTPFLSFIKSQRQLTYLEAETMLREARLREDNDFSLSNAENISQQLHHIWQFMIVLRKQRLGIGLFFQQPNFGKFDVFINDCSAHMMIEEAMITYNACSAIYLKNKGSYLVRTQDPPSMDKWTEWCRQYKESIKLSMHQKSTVDFMDSLTSTKENRIMPTLRKNEVVTKEQIPVLLKVANAILKALNRNDIESAMILLSDTMQPAITPGNSGLIKISESAVNKVMEISDTLPSGHFSLHLPLYSWCTSPIRRYSDIVSQRLMLSSFDRPKSKGNVISLQHARRDNHKVGSIIEVRTAEAKEYDEGMLNLSLAQKLQLAPQSYNCIVASLTDRSIVFSFLGMGKMKVVKPVKYPDILIHKAKPYIDHLAPPNITGEKRVWKIELEWIIYFYDYKTRDHGIAATMNGQLGIPSATKFVSKQAWQVMNNTIEEKLKSDTPFVGQNDREEIKETIQRVFENLKDGRMCKRRQKIQLGPCTSDKCEGKCPRHWKRNKDCDDCKLIPDQCFDYMMDKSRLEIKHRRRIKMTVVPGSIFNVQLMSTIQRFLLLPSIKLLSIAPDLSICIYHKKNPIEAFAPNVKPAKQKNMTSLESYKEQWLPILRLDGIYSAVSDGDPIIISGVDVQWKTVSKKKGIVGNFQLTKKFCKQRYIKIYSDDVLCMRFSNQDRDQELNQCVEHGIVLSRDEKGQKEETVTFKFFLPESLQPKQLPESATDVTVEVISLGAPHRKMANALAKLPSCESNDVVNFLCLGEDIEPHITPNEEITEFLNNVGKECLRGFDYKLNFVQAQQVCKALINKATLIQGPPGTGKSYMGAQLACYFLKFNKLQGKPNLTSRILYCGPSNKSVDVVADYLKNSGFNVLRVYGKLREEEDFPNPLKPIPMKQKSQTEESKMLKSIALHHKIRESGNKHAEEIKTYDKKFSSLEPVMLEDIKTYNDLVNKAKLIEIATCQILVSTCISACQVKELQQWATKNKIHEAEKILFSQCIVDESGMCSEPETLVPIISASADQVVLIGDHKQLQPIIMCPRAAELGLKKSMFERIEMSSQGRFGMLTTQYRMHKSICEFPSNKFYNGQLTVASSVNDRERKYPSKFYHGSPDNTALFCHVVGEEDSTIGKSEHPDTSKCNTIEASAVIGILKKLHYNLKIDLSKIMILSPYLAQCDLIKNLIKDSGVAKVHVGTVVTSQGGERDYVILSTVRSQKLHSIEDNPSLHWIRKYLGFITDPHQINVAITRARKGLCIVGNKHLLCQDQETWCDLLKSYETRGAVLNLEDKTAPWA